MAVSVTHFVTKSEAQAFPGSYLEMGGDAIEQIQSSCPPFLRYRIIHSPFFIHPCMRNLLNQTPIVSTPVTQVIPEATSTLESASSTPETATSTTSTTTETISTHNATTTRAEETSVSVTE